MLEHVFIWTLLTNEANCPNIRNMTGKELPVC